MSTIRLVLILAAMILVVPAAARAATVSVRPDDPGATLAFAATPGEANAVTITSGLTSTTITDTGAPLTAGSGCTSTGTHTATCAGVAVLDARLGDEDDSLALTTTAPLFAGTVDAGEGDDTVDLRAARARANPMAGGGIFVVGGGAGNDHVLGSPGEDELSGGAGDDHLEAGAGDDVLVGDDPAPDAATTNGDPGRGGADRLNGGPGTDTVTYENRNAGVRINLAAHRGGAGGHEDRYASIENATGSRGRDVIYGTGGPNVLRAPSGSASGDTIRAFGGADRIEAADGASRINAGAGADSLFGLRRGHVIACGAGTDTIYDSTSLAARTRAATPRLPVDCDRVDGDDPDPVPTPSGPVSPQPAFDYVFGPGRRGGVTFTLPVRPRANHSHSAATVTLRSPGGAVWGRASFHTAQRLTVRVALNAAGRAAARRHRVAFVGIAQGSGPFAEREGWRRRL